MEHQIFSFAKMILCDTCSTSYDLASLFRGRRNTLDRWNLHWYEAVRSALNFPFLKKSRRIASFMTLSSSKIEKFSQNCCASDVIKFNFEEVKQNYNDNYNDNTLHYTTYITLRYTTLHYSTLH